MTDNETPVAETTLPAVSGTCPNLHEHALHEGNVIADYGKCWRVRCGTCRIIFSVSKK